MVFTFSISPLLEDWVRVVAKTPISNIVADIAHGRRTHICSRNASAFHEVIIPSELTEYISFQTIVTEKGRRDFEARVGAIGVPVKYANVVMRQGRVPWV